METSNFKHLLTSRAPISQNEAEELEVLLQKYPYLQSARALQLKAYKTNFDTRYNQALKITAAYTTDRSVLFDYITSNDFKFFKAKENQSQKIDTKKNNITVVPILDDEKKVTLKDEETFAKSTEIIAAASTLEIGKPLSFDANDTYSFNEWLQLAALKPIDRSPEIITETDSSSTKKELQSTLIDHFISKNPKLKSADKNSPVLNIAEKAVTPNESLMTETLARVYLEQKKYENAIKAYKILSLKYPEKSGYFADQIKAIKNLQNNNIS